MATQEQLLAALAAVTDPNTGKDFVSTKALKNLQLNGAKQKTKIIAAFKAEHPHGHEHA